MPRPSASACPTIPEVSTLAQTTVFHPHVTSPSLHTDDALEVLVLFTSPERAKNFVQDYPGYDGGLLVEFKWVLERTGSGVGISLNPTWPVGMDLEAEMVQRLRTN